MLEYNKIGVSVGININKTDDLHECIIFNAINFFKKHTKQTYIRNMCMR